MIQKTTVNLTTSWRDYKLDPRYFIILFLFSFVLAGQLYLGFFQNWNDIIASVITSTLTELLLARIVIKKWTLSTSPVITGLGVSLLLSSDLVWPYVLTSFLSIGIKYLVRYKGSHLFNPNNVAMVLVLFFLPQFAVSTPKQWSNSYGIMALVVLLGLIVAYLAKRLDTVLSFLVSFSLFALIRHSFFGSPLLIALGPLLGASLQLFAFFMLTDPKTTPTTRNARIVFSFIIAGIDAFFRVQHFPNPQFYAQFLVSIFLMIPYRYFLHKEVQQLSIQEREGN